MKSLRRTLLATLLLAANCAFSQEAAPPEVPAKSALNAASFYQILLGELAANQGDSAQAFQWLLDAARKSNDAKLYERTVEIALRARAGESALQAAQAWAKAQPASKEANRYVLQVLINLNRIAETVEPIRRELAGLSVADKNATMSLLPRNFARVTDKKLVNTVLEQALAGELSNPATGAAAWFAIGTSRLAAGNTNGATEAAEKGHALNPQAREPAMLALGLMDANNPAAEALVLKTLAQQPHPELRLTYARKLLEVQRFSDALSQMRGLTKEAPEYAEGWLILGSLELQERRFEVADQALNKYLALLAAKPASTGDAAEADNRGRTQAYLMLSQSAEQTQRMDLARSFLEKIGDESGDMRVQVRRASLLAREGRLEHARALIRAIPEKETGDERLKLNAEVQLLRDAKQFAAAFDLLKQAAKQTPQDADLIYELAMAAEKVGKLTEMESYLRQIMVFKPDYHHAYNALGYSLAERKTRLGEARKLIQKALEFAPNDPFIVDSLAWVEYRSGNAHEALRLLQDAFKTRQDAEIAAHLGEVLWSLNRRSEARVVWDEGMAINPDNETLKETIKRLNRP